MFRAQLDFEGLKKMCPVSYTASWMVCRRGRSDVSLGGIVVDCRKTHRYSRFACVKRMSCMVEKDLTTLVNEDRQVYITVPLTTFTGVSSRFWSDFGLVRKWSLRSALRRTLKKTSCYFCRGSPPTEVTGNERSCTCRSWCLTLQEIYR